MRMARNIKLTIEYDGTDYHGWQSQDNALSIQSVITDAIEKIAGEKVKLYGSGRTDAGVHAFGQVANFHTKCGIPVGKIPAALNSILPDDIVIKNAEEVSRSFHSRYSCRGKTYRYVILNSPMPSAFMRNKVAHFPHALDIEAMREACGYLCGTKDFSAFCAAGSSVKDFTRTITAADIKKKGDIIEFTVTGNGFLRNMVRIIVGTLIEVGRGKMSPEEFGAVIDSRNRKNAGMTMPAHGLYLEEVFY